MVPKRPGSRSRPRRLPLWPGADHPAAWRPRRRAGTAGDGPAPRPSLADAAGPAGGADPRRTPRISSADLKASPRLHARARRQRPLVRITIDAIEERRRRPDALVAEFDSGGGVIPGVAE